MTIPHTGVFAQEAFRIDHERGRIVIDDSLRAIDPYWYAIDHDRGILYVNDSEEPNGVMAFSLATGERLRSIAVPQGEGPGELTGFGGVVLAPGGGLYVWSYPRAVRFDSLGVVVGDWRPELARYWRDLCVFGGQPSVPTAGGLVRRGADGRDEGIGLDLSDRGTLRIETAAEAASVIGDLLDTRLACTESLAFLLPTRAGRPDSVLVYSRDGFEGGLAVPSELIGDSGGSISERLDLLADDGRGNLVLLGSDFGRVPGAVMDPESGCHALVRNSALPPFRQFVGVYADSALVFHWNYEEDIRGGETFIQVWDNVNRVSLHPLESLGGGEACPEVLPSVRSGGARGSR